MSVPAMAMEHVAGYKEVKLIGDIYYAVHKQQTIIIEYQSFKARQSKALVVYPYLLKEYRNRWFLIGEKASNHVPQVNIFALDRIQSVTVDKEHPFKKCVDFDPEHFFDDTIGVTKGIHDKARRVVIKIDRQQAPYVESKPFHKSQKVEQRFRDGSIQLSLKVVINNELERLILSNGGHAEISAPPEFRSRIAGYRICFLLFIVLYRKMRHHWCNFALMKKCRNKIAVRKMTAQQQSNFAVSPSGKPPRIGIADICSRLTHEDSVVA